MIYDVMEHYELEKEFRNAGYFETENYRQIFLDLKTTIRSGHLVALTGIIGCGKTTAARHIRKELKKEGDILISTNLAVDKDRVNLSTLIYTLFADLVTEKDYKVPSKLELRERKLRELIMRRKKPVALFIDEAHDLHHKTLVGLKRLIEVVQEADSTLSIVLIGHPKLKIDLNRPAMEEIGARATMLDMHGIKGSESKYIYWLFSQCLKGDELKATDVFTEESITYMAEKLHTPLQINSYAWKALVEAHQIGQKPVEIETLQAVISEDLDGLEAKLQRYGYNLKSLGETIDAKPSEIRAYLRGRLATARSQEIQSEMLKLGIM